MKVNTLRKNPILPFVRSRQTSSGQISTTLIESYRDEHGKPRQRILVNLNGAATTLMALAKLTAQAERLRAEKAKLDRELDAANARYKRLTTASLNGYNFSSSQRKEIDRLLRNRERLMIKTEKVAAKLAQIKKDSVIVKKHCDSTDEEILSATRTYKEELRDAEAATDAAEFIRDQFKHVLRGLPLG